MKVVSYLSGIPPKNKNLEKPAILQNFTKGVNRTGDTGILHNKMDLIPCDVALIQGFTHEHGKRQPHLQLRSRVIDFQKSNNNKTLIADSNLFLYADTSNPFHYLRYSFDGVFKNTGFYFDKDIDSTRWKKISQDTGLILKDYRTNGKHILICLQRNGGWSMRGLDVMEWCRTTIKKIKEHTDRPIIVRGHPGDKKAFDYLKLDLPNVTISNTKVKSIKDDLKDAWATITYNSSPGVASLIEGVPVFALDPDPNYSQYSEIANHSLKRLEDPKMYDRQEWIERISMSHWKFSELQSGEAWQFMKNYVRQ
jgi:hypothetical protein